MKKLLFLGLLLCSTAFADSDVERYGSGGGGLASVGSGTSFSGGDSNSVIYVDGSGAMNTEEAFGYNDSTDILTVSGGFVSGASADPGIVFDVLTATDTDYWIAVNEDAGSDDDDSFNIGKGGTKNTNPFYTYAEAGTHTFRSAGNTNNENVTIDLETTANRALVSSSSSAIWRMDMDFMVADQIGLFIGSAGSESSFQLDTTETNDSLKLGLGLNSSASSGNFMLVELADIDTNFSAANVTNPTLRIQSANATTPTDALRLYHNQTDGVIDTIGGDLNLAPAGGDVNVTGNIKPSANYLAADGSTGHSGTTCTAFENGICTAGT